MRRETSFVFQNIDGDGVPTLGGDVVALVECPKDMSRIRKWSFPKHEFVRKEMNYRMAAFLNDERVKVTKVESHLVHLSRKRPPSPRRTWLEIECEIDGWETTIYIGHAINSAWRPAWVPTTWKKTRRELWWKWFDKGAALIRASHKKGRLVIVLCDGNRARGDWNFPGTRRVMSHGPDEVFVSTSHESRPQVLNRRTGPKTGNGRVTHASMRFVLSLVRRAQRGFTPVS